MPAPGQGELTLQWGAVHPAEPEPQPSAWAAGGPPRPEWLLRLHPDDRRRVASLAWERRPLVFLVDAKARWTLVRPRLPLAGFDAVDFRDQPDGDYQILAPSDTSARELQHLLRCLRETRPPRAAACERIAWTGRELAALAHCEDLAGAGVHPEVASVQKNS